MKETTGTRLKKIMKEKGLKQVDILRMCEPYCKRYNVKLEKNDLSQYVNDKVQPKQDKLSILGMALNVPEIWLMGYDLPNKDNDIAKAMELYEKYQNAIPEIQEAVENLLKASKRDP